MLFAVSKAALVNPAIGPSVNTLTLLFVVEIVTSVNSAIRPSEFALSVHLVVSPLTDVLGSIRPLESAVSMLLSLVILAIVVRAIRPLLSAFAFLLVVNPVASVHGSFGVVVLTVAVSLVVLPVSSEHVAICKDEAPEPIRHVRKPKAFVLRAVRPDLDSVALFGAVFLVPLARVDLAVRQLLAIHKAQFRSQHLDLLLLALIENQRALKSLLVNDRDCSSLWNADDILWGYLLTLLTSHESDESHLLCELSDSMSAKNRLELDNHSLGSSPGGIILWQLRQLGQSDLPRHALEVRRQKGLTILWL